MEPNKRRKVEGNIKTGNQGPDLSTIKSARYKGYECLIVDISTSHTRGFNR